MFLNDRTINETEYISLEDILESEREWREK
jgi:hypothetical protein